jgi:hypothetical protein
MFLDRLERYGFKIPNTTFLPVSLSPKKKAV